MSEYEENSIISEIIRNIFIASAYSAFFLGILSLAIYVFLACK